MKILLAADGSPHSKAAVEEVARRPFPPNTKARIVTAYESPPLIATTEPISMSQMFYAEAHRLALKKAENSAENAAKILRRKNSSLTISTVVTEGSPKSVILHEAETFGADLIVVGSHGYGTVKRFMLGSVSHAVSLHAKCSVEIVRK